jgi:hypothetical protein
MPPPYKLAALVILLPVTVVWLSFLPQALWAALVELTTGDSDYARIRRLDTAAGSLLMLFGILGIAGLWLWVMSPLKSRASRIVTAAFVLLGLTAALPALMGMRMEFMLSLPLAGACLLGIAALITLMRHNRTVDPTRENPTARGSP